MRSLLIVAAWTLGVVLLLGAAIWLDTALERRHVRLERVRRTMHQLMLNAQLGAVSCAILPFAAKAVRAAVEMEVAMERVSETLAQVPPTLDCLREANPVPEDGEK